MAKWLDGILGVRMHHEKIILIMVIGNLTI